MGMDGKLLRILLRRNIKNRKLRIRKRRKHIASCVFGRQLYTSSVRMFSSADCRMLFIIPTQRS